jgi:hypothetical protein
MLNPPPYRPAAGNMQNRSACRLSVRESSKLEMPVSTSSPCAIRQLKLYPAAASSELPA